MLRFAEFVCCCFLVANIITVLASSSTGYDSIECDPHSSRARTGRARLIASIPCDLTKQSYCNLPGEFYPWNAVKKFVYENQGLVRRMYGDMRHIFVMQSELENEIDLDDIQHSADKYSKAFNTHNQRQMRAKKVNDKKNFRSDTEPYFRPAQRPPSALNSKQKTKPPKIPSNEPGDSDVLIDNLIKTNIDALTEEVEMKVSLQTKSTTKLTTVTSSSSTTPSSSTIHVKADIDHKEESKTVAPTSTTVDKEVSNLLSNTSTTTLTPSEAVQETSSMEEEESTEKLSSTLKNESIHKLVEDFEEEALNDLDLVASTLEETLVDVSDRNNSKEPLTTTTETQLFQDTVQKEKEPAPVINRRGVNACPVKEEVVAPFWGNNTRGEVLALLNVYPFEQYINWEKCTHEHEQMYCRTGCKCEQQYRLHRLLAYNPLDACRGIFSDWFRFPSCCICKCYDIPFDYRVTSRSPRGSEKMLQTEVDDDESFPSFEDDINFFDPE